MIILKGGEVHPISRAPFVGDVAFEGGKIVEVGQDIFVPGAEIVDVCGKFVMPGLVDAHSHVGLEETGSREKDHNEKGRPITPEMRGIDAIHPADAGFAGCRSVGITTAVTGPGSINLIGGTFAAVKTAGDTVEEMLLRDPLAMKMALGENPTFRYREIGKEPYSRMGSAAIIRQALTKARDYAVKKQKGLLQDTDLGLEALTWVLDGKIPMKIHCHRADDIMTAIRIMNEFDIRYTLDHCSEGYMIPDALHEALNTRCNGVILGPLFSYARKLELRNKLRGESGARFYQLGIPFAICTDYPDGFLESLMLGASMSAAMGVPMETALRSITLDAAVITGIGDRVGSLEPGKDADIAVFNGNPLNCMNLCCMTYINGKLVYQRA